MSAKFPHNEKGVSMAQPSTTTRQVATSQHDDDDHRVVHAVAVGFAAFFWLIAAAAVLRFTHVPGWIPLLVHITIGAALTVAGFTRKPRPLKLRSVAYRFLASFLAGQWLFWNIADVGPGGQEVLAMICQLLLVGLVVAILYYGIRAKHWKYAVGVAGLALCAGESLITALVGTAGGGAGVWIEHVLTTTAPLDGGNFFAWLWPGAAMSAGTLCVVGTILGEVFAGHEREEKDKQEFTQMVRAASRAELAMTAVLQEFSGNKKLMAVPGGMKLWSNGAGETYEIYLGGAGIGWKDLNSYAESIAARMMLLDGCGVEAAKGRNRGYGLLHVSRVDKLAENHMYPINEIKKRNIYEGLPVGILRPGDEVCIKIRENGVYVVGQKRSGKTIWLESLMVSIATTDDTLVWVIDFNGGGVAIPFLYAWAEGRAAKPMIDWVADTEEEALIMLQAALDIAFDRKQFYRHRKRKSGKTLLPVDREVPQIIIILDEGAEAMGAASSAAGDKVGALLEKLQRVAGDSGFNQVFSLLRATGDMANPAVKKMAPIRVGMRVSDSEELAYLFGEWKMDPADAPHQGSGFILADHGEPVRVFKGYNLDQALMDQAAVITADWRPWMDPRGRQVGGARYRNRWVRMQHLLLDEHGNINPNLNLDLDSAAPANLSTADVQAPTGKPAPAQGPAAPAGTATAVLDPDADIDQRLTRRRQIAGMDSSDIEGRTENVLDGLRRLSGDRGGEVDDAAWDQIAAAPELADLPAWPSDPAAGPPRPAPKPSGGEQAPSGGGGPVDRLATLEKLVLQYGPIGRSELWEKLKEAGIRVSLPTMDKDLERADWVAPREKGQPYDHKKRQGGSKP